jgi:hypothetical protein
VACFNGCCPYGGGGGFSFVGDTDMLYECLHGLGYKLIVEDELKLLTLEQYDAHDRGNNRIKLNKSEAALLITQLSDALKVIEG